MSLPLLTIGAPSNGPFERGRIDCIQDSNENNPFGSTGGLSQRHDLQRPMYISPEEWPRYREGYEAQARQWWGPEWRTVPFGWSHVATIVAGAGQR